MTDAFGRPIDLDQSGHGFHKARSYLGPSLGWIDTQILPERRIETGGQTIQVDPGDQVILTEVGTPVTFLLPDVRAWVAQTATQPATGFTRGLVFKDYGGNARDVHVTIVPFDNQTIDGLNQSIILSQDYETIVLHPLIDETGWYASVQTFDTGTGGTTSINPTAPIIGNVTGDVMNVGMLFDPVAFKVNVANQLAFHDISPGFILGNPTNATATPVYSSLSSILDRAIGSTQGQLMFRNNAQWTFLNPGAVGTFLASGGPGSNPQWLPSITDAAADGKYYGRRNNAWVDLDTRYLQLTGGTITGDLVINAANPALRLNSTGGTNDLVVMGKAGFVRWSLQLRNPDTGGDAGSDLAFIRFHDDGSGIDAPFIISRLTGELTLNHNLNLPGPPSTINQAATKGYVDSALSGLGTVYQPLDGDLTALANLGGTNTIYYRSGANTWTPVAMGANMAFSGGVLSSSGGGGGGGGDVFKGFTNVFTATNFFTQPTVMGASTLADPAIALQVVNNDSVFQEFSADALGPIMRFRKSRSATVGVNAIVQDQDALGSVSFEGADGGTYLGGTGLFAFVDGTPTAGSINSALVLASRQAGASGGSARVWVAPKGHVSHNMRWNNDPNNATDSVASFANPDNTQSGTRISIFDFGGGAAPATPAGIWFRKNRAGGNPAVFGATLDNDGAQISSAGCDGTGYVNHSAISMFQDGAVVGPGQIPGKIVFNTRGTSGGNVSRMTIWNNGIVEIGNNLTAPVPGSSGLLQVQGGQITLDALTGNQCQFVVTSWQNAAGSGFLTFKHTRGGAIGTFAAVQAGDPLGTIQFWGSNATAFTPQPNADIICSVESAVGAADTVIGTRLSFLVTRTALAEQMRLTGNGCLQVGSANLGIEPGSGIIVAGGLYGTQTNDLALINCVGEYGQVIGNAGAPVTLTAGGVNLVSVNLTGGDWDVWGGAIVNQGTAVGFILIGISTVSGSVDGTVGNYAQFAAGNISGAVMPMFTQRRISVPSGGQTIYMAANCSNGSPAAYGWLMYRRRR